jgi:glycine betaine/proline transport system permease protein
VADNFPDLIDMRAVRSAIDGWFNGIVSSYGQALETAFLPVLRLLNGIEAFLLWVPWFVLIPVVALVSFAATRDWRMPIAVIVMLFLTGLLGLWQPAMATVALMLTATLFAIVTGIPLGILMSFSNRLQAVMLPILDVMQTMPIFVYLIPFVMLFGPGKIPALLATIVFSVPPLIRLTNLGIRGVNPEVIEAVTAFGATPMQKLFAAQLPLATPTIMAGINQTTMMALSMVVIASMIGAGGLGYEVLQGIQRLDVSRGLFAGLGIVFLAIIFDRLVQAYGKRVQKHLDAGNT